MKREDAIRFLENISLYQQPDSNYRDALEMAINALETIGHLTGRPCDVCEYHSEQGCCKWDCVFKGV